MDESNISYDGLNVGNLCGGFGNGTYALVEQHRAIAATIKVAVDNMFGEMK